MNPLDHLLSKLRMQHAPESHLSRLTELVDLAQRQPGLRAIFLVGSYARGTGDRVSDLDLVAIAAPGQSLAVFHSTHDQFTRSEVLNQFTGKHSSGGAFWKAVYLDFSSVEFHVFEPDTSFKLKRPYLPVWDPSGMLPTYLAEGEPIHHEDFAAYEYGDEGLIWELVDCIKWLSRGRNELARNHLKKMVEAFSKPAHAD